MLLVCGSLVRTHWDSQDLKTAGRGNESFVSFKETKDSARMRNCRNISRSLRVFHTTSSSLWCGRTPFVGALINYLIYFFTSFVCTKRYIPPHLISIHARWYCLTSLNTFRSHHLISGFLRSMYSPRIPSWSRMTPDSSNLVNRTEWYLGTYRWHLIMPSTTNPHSQVGEYVHLSFIFVSVPIRPWQPKAQSLRNEQDVVRCKSWSWVA